MTDRSEPPSLGEPFLLHNNNFPERDRDGQLSCHRPRHGTCRRVGVPKKKQQGAMLGWMRLHFDNPHPPVKTLLIVTHLAPGWGKSHFLMRDSVGSRNFAVPTPGPGGKWMSSLQLVRSPPPTLRASQVSNRWLRRLPCRHLLREAEDLIAPICLTFPTKPMTAVWVHILR